MVPSLLLALVACGGDAEPAGTPSEGAAAPQVQVFPVSDEKTTCNDLCASYGRACVDTGFKWEGGKEGGAVVNHGCQTCYGGRVLKRCDGTLVESKLNNKSGPYMSTECACTPAPKDGG